MTKVKNLWMAVLLGTLLMVTLAGVAGARLNDRPQAAVTRRISVPPAFFDPRDEVVNWDNRGEYIKSDTNASLAYFYAPVVFPTGQAVVVESVTIYAFDNNASYQVCVYLRKTNPTWGPEDTMAYACSTGAQVGIRNFSDTSIVHNPMKHGKGIYLELEIPDDTDLRVYGVSIQYHHGTT